MVTISEEDIRIYSAPKQASESEKSNDMERVLEAMREHRNNGNLAKAKQLGKALSDARLDFENLVSAKYMKPDILYQIKALYVFSAEANLQMFVYDPLLYTTAINSMYEEIQKNEEGFYKNISSGVAYSFYYSEMKKGGDVTANIGKAFAMLCSAPSSDSFCETGKALYEKFAAEVEKQIEQTQFKQI